MEVFWKSLIAIFLLELGDKTQLVALSLATRFKARVVLAGILFATLLVHILSVAIGGCVGKLLPQDWIAYSAGLAFIGFGLWTLRGDELEDGEADDKRCKGSSPFWIVTCTFFLAELGDKTMLSTVALATEHQKAIALVWIGSSLGMVVSDGLAIALGQLLGRSLPEKFVKIGAACIFFGFGIYKTLAGGMNLPPYAWVMGAAIVIALVFIFFRPQPKKLTREQLEIQGEALVEQAFEDESVKTRDS